MGRYGVHRQIQQRWELSEAINSMYTWYAKAEVCYAYLSDLETRLHYVPWQERLGDSRWFSRGWTLQELIALQVMIFYAKDWVVLGSRADFCAQLSQITRIDEDILFQPTRRALQQLSIATRMSWAANRTTSRVEDIAYCLLGIFNVNMPLLYGEGEKAFIRLQEAIMKDSDDHADGSPRRSEFFIVVLMLGSDPSLRPLKGESNILGPYLSLEKAMLHQHDSSVESSSYPSNYPEVFHPTSLLRQGLRLVVDEEDVMGQQMWVIELKLNDNARFEEDEVTEVDDEQFASEIRTEMKGYSRPQRNFQWISSKKTINTGLASLSWNGETTAKFDGDESLMRAYTSQERVKTVIARRAPESEGVANDVHIEEAEEEFANLPEYSYYTGIRDLDDIKSDEEEATTTTKEPAFQGEETSAPEEGSWFAKRLGWFGSFFWNLTVHSGILRIAPTGQLISRTTRMLPIFMSMSSFVMPLSTTLVKPYGLRTMAQSTAQVTIEVCKAPRDLHLACQDITSLDQDGKTHFQPFQSKSSILPFKRLVLPTIMIHQRRGITTPLCDQHPTLKIPRQHLIFKTLRFSLSISPPFVFIGPIAMLIRSTPLPI